jgi:hypothetical protein
MNPETLACASSTDETEIVHLTTPMTLRPGTSLIVKCAARIELHTNGVGPLYLGANLPILLSSPTSLRIRSTADFGPAFAQGWYKLPDELKISVLEHNIRRGPSVTSLSFSRIHPTRACSDYSEYLRHLRMTPEISSLSKKIFYAQNIFLVDVPRTGIGLKLPNSTVRPTIRKLYVTIGYSVASWDVLGKLSNKEFGFQNLTSLVVQFDSPLSMRRKDLLLQHVAQHPVAFSCAGSAKVGPQALRRWRDGSDPRKDGRFAAMNVIASRISFKG